MVDLMVVWKAALMAVHWVDKTVASKAASKAELTAA